MNMRTQQLHEMADTTAKLGEELTSGGESTSGDFTPVAIPEELPKGQQNASALIFTQRK